MSHQLDTIHCQHCKAIIALVAQRAIVHRFKLRCTHCDYENAIQPPKKQQHLDIVEQQAYTLAEV